MASPGTCRVKHVRLSAVAVVFAVGTALPAPLAFTAATSDTVKSAAATSPTAIAATTTSRTAAVAATTSSTAVAAAPTSKTASVAAATPATMPVSAGTTKTASVAAGSTGTVAVAASTTKTANAVTATTGTKPAASATTATTSASAKPTTASTEIPLQFYQIAIEAIVVEVNEKYTRQIGMQITYGRDPGEGSNVRGVDINNPVSLPQTLVPQMNIIPGGFNFTDISRTLGAGFSLTDMSAGSGQIGMRMRGLIEEGKAQIRSRPLAVTLNKQAVQIETVDKSPYQDVTFGADGSSKIAVQFEPVGVKLHVTPSIKSLEEGLVEMNLTKLEVSAVGRFVNFQSVQRPVFLKSEANTRVIVHNHDTLVIGGFKIEQETNAGQGVPFVRRVPVLKYIFGNESKNLERRDILFYITPHVLSPGVQPTLPPKFEHREAVADILQIPPLKEP